MSVDIPSARTPFLESGNDVFVAGYATEPRGDQETLALGWQLHRRIRRLAFGQITMPLTPAEGYEYPAPPADQRLSGLSFLPLPGCPVADGVTLTFRRPEEPPGSGPGLAEGKAHTARRTERRTVRIGEGAAVEIGGSQFAIKIHSPRCARPIGITTPASNRGLPGNRSLPLSFARDAELRWYLALPIDLSASTVVMGGGESFTSPDKRGQILQLWTSDAHGAASALQYKPVPVFVTNEGWGIYLETTLPVTADVGASNAHQLVFYLPAFGEARVHFLFGTPRQILSTYSRLTGAAPRVPIWSFGLWISRISYRSQAESLETARRLRDLAIPSDVLHVDTGWFEHDWQCDWRFCPQRFPDPSGFVQTLKELGYRLSLWQLPYLWRGNRWEQEIRERGLTVDDGSGGSPLEMKILDFTNPATVEWYRARIRELRNIGVAALKTDFGESAPRHGRYASGADGLVEHNRYPLVYNEAAWDVFGADGDSVLWARSGWAGSQRFPVHWGGDAETSDVGMMGSLYGALSLGMSGFTYWSVDLGGFTRSPDEELYRRWLAFGLLLSHSRCHGEPPREPWHYSDEFVAYFRAVVRLRYALLPYIVAQAYVSAEGGLPFARPLCVEFPEDALSWRVHDEFLAGESLLVAPFFRACEAERDVYLPPGEWHDLFTGTVHSGRSVIRYSHGAFPVGVFLRGGHCIPIARRREFRNTEDLDLGDYRLLASAPTARGWVYDIPADSLVRTTADTDSPSCLAPDEFFRE